VNKDNLRHQKRRNLVLGSEAFSAVRRYLDAPSSSLLESLRREQELHQERELVALLSRMSSRFDLDEDEAMDLVNTEIRAMYEERREARAREEEQQLGL
jgi:hypothetical protein